VSPFPVEGPEWASHVVVVGGGIAGTSAALAATREGASVILLDGGTGASTLATGGIDLTPWQLGGVSTDALAPNVKAVLEALGGYVVPEGGAKILTTAGVVRPARGHDAALLDVARLGQGRVAVVSCQRPGWHAGTLATAWGAAFEKLDAEVLRYADEETIPDADFSARHDDEDRLGWLAERLRAGLARAQGRWKAVVLPPALGVEQPRAEALSRRVGVPCGEPI
jgi:glycerol-3-phosphate dehydrogenase subunit B